MLKKDEYYSKAEDEILKNSVESINYVKNQMKEVLDAKMKSESVVKDSVSELNAMPVNDYGNMQGFDTSNTAVQTNDKVRVRKIEGPIKSVIPQSAPMVEETQNNNYNVGNYNNTNNFNNYTQGPMNGVSTTSILLSTVVLIFLVFLVSTAVIIYFGIK